MALILLLNFVVLVGAVTIVYRHHDAWMRASQPLQHTGPMPPPHAAVPAAGQ